MLITVSCSWGIIVYIKSNITLGHIGMFNNHSPNINCKNKSKSSLTCVLKEDIRGKLKDKDSM